MNGSDSWRTAAIIAIVDDDADVRGSVESLMRSAGIEACSFASAEALLASPLCPRIDCIVTDLHMPGLDGLGLQLELRRRGLAVPVIVVTGFPDPAAQQRAIDAGALAFLAKPVDPDILLDLVEGVLRRARD
ncbi:response regulator [Sphingomonas sp. ZT3P38]|uniref:response regulator transcription factor n=1 Tax=Parasphingomonas zepuensis TaxID=3096161 RepID=UPI002FCA5600